MYIEREQVSSSWIEDNPSPYGPYETHEVISDEWVESAPYQGEKVSESWIEYDSQPYPCETWIEPEHYAPIYHRAPPVVLPPHPMATYSDPVVYTEPLYRESNFYQTATTFAKTLFFTTVAIGTLYVVATLFSDQSSPQKEPEPTNRDPNGINHPYCPAPFTSTSSVPHQPVYPTFTPLNRRTYRRFPRNQIHPPNPRKICHYEKVCRKIAHTLMKKCHLEKICKYV
jgi:hypothetical protein